MLWQHELNTFNLQQAKKRLKTFSPKGPILRENHYFSLAEEIAGKPLFFLEGGGGVARAPQPALIVDGGLTNDSKWGVVK